MAAQFDRIKFDAKPWYTEAQNAGIDMLVTSPAMGSNAPPATVGATGILPVKAGNGLTNGESFNNGVKNSTIETKVVIEPKIEKQISSRGWTVDSIVETVSKPSETIATKDTRFDPTTGTRKNDSATAYINADGSYVVVNNKDQTVVQVSDRTDPNWKAPWSTKND
jgi:filamentous hemagglutinin